MAEEVIIAVNGSSTFGIICMIALTEKQVKYEVKDEIQKSPVDEKIPPSALIHNGKHVSCGSMITLQYIDETWKDTSPLLPSDPYERAQARFWADYVVKKAIEWHAKISDPKEKETASKEILETLKQVESVLGDKAYFGGETMGFLDVMILPLNNTFPTIEALGNISIETSCPKLVAWAKRCMEKESVSKSLEKYKDTENNGDDRWFKNWTIKSPYFDDIVINFGSSTKKKSKTSAAVVPTEEVEQDLE